MRRINTYSLFLLLPVMIHCKASHAQENNKTKPLIDKLEQAAPDTNKVDLLIKLSDAYAEIASETAADHTEAKQASEKALECADEALELSRQLAHEAGKAESLFMKGKIYFQLYSDYQKALELYQQARDIFLKEDRINRATRIMSLTGTINHILGNYKEAEALFEEAYRINKKYNYTEWFPDNLNDLAGIYMVLNKPEKVFEFYEEALALSIENNDSIGICRTILNMGNYHGMRDEFDKATEFYEQALELAIKLKDQDWEAAICENMGIIQYNIGNYEEAQKMIQKSIDIKATLNDQNGIAHSLYNITLVYAAQDNYSEALKASSQATKIYEELGDRRSMIQSMSPMISFYIEQKEYEKAIETAEKNLALCRETEDKSMIAEAIHELATSYEHAKHYEKALKLFTEALESYQELNFPSGVVTVWEGMGSIYREQGYYKKSLTLFQRAIELNDSIGNKGRALFLMEDMARLYTFQEQYDTAISYYEKALTLAVETGTKDMIMWIPEHIASCYEKLGQHDIANQYLRQHMAAKDSLYTETKSRQLSELRTKYETAQKEKEIEKLTKEQALKEAEIARQKQVRNTAVLSLAFGFILLFVGYSRYQSRKRLQMERRQMELEQKALHLQMNPHFLFNALESISSFVSKNDFKPALSFLAKFAKLMRLTLENSQKAWVPLEQEIATLRYYIELEQLRFNNQFDFDIRIDEDISEETPIPTMLIQPFVENAIIHGLAPKETIGTLELHFTEKQGHLVCEIKDNGIGREKARKIKAQREETHESMAMHIVEERLNILNRTKKTAMKLQIADLKEKAGETGTSITLDMGPLAA